MKWLIPRLGFNRECTGNALSVDKILGVAYPDSDEQYLNLNCEGITIFSGVTESALTQRSSLVMYIYIMTKWLYLKCQISLFQSFSTVRYSACLSSSFFKEITWWFNRIVSILILSLWQLYFYGALMKTNLSTGNMSLNCSCAF